jgi:hypothetical protein
MLNRVLISPEGSWEIWIHEGRKGVVVYTSARFPKHRLVAEVRKNRRSAERLISHLEIMGWCD